MTHIIRSDAFFELFVTLGPDQPSRRPVAVALGLIVVLCLTPSAEEEVAFRLCLICEGQGLSDVVLNVLLYVPLGFALRHGGASLPRVIAAGFLVSLGVEALQLVIPGRFTSPADLAANTLGGGLGWFLAFDPGMWLRPREGVRRYLSWGWACLASALVVLSCAALRPVLPEGQIFVGWTPDLGGHAQYPGSVVDASVDGEPLPSARPISPQALQRFESGGRVHVRFTFHPVGQTLAPVLQVTAGDYGEALMIGMRDDDVVIRRRLRSAELRMATPEVVFSGPWEVAAGDSWDLEFMMDGDGRYLLTARGPNHSASYVDGIGSERGWSVWHYPPGLPAWFETIIDLVWILVLVAPAAFWARSWPMAVGAGALPLATTAAAPLFTAALVPSPALLLWGCVVVVAGAGLGMSERVSPRGST